METLVEIKLPLPLDIVSNIMDAVGGKYPGSKVLNPEGSFLTMLVPDEDRFLDDETEPEPSIPAEKIRHEHEATVISVTPAGITVEPPKDVSDTFTAPFVDALTEVDSLSFEGLTSDSRPFSVHAHVNDGRRSYDELERLNAKYAQKLEELGVNLYTL